ncbi:hypothetical protein K503DRAFT_774535 [Rhizopogon vinicolor AM-OR11-026]|uniref:Uncharacterized protein n=1 Tax=Rhizopogon vinicolor AM-OR11-026 TaxID=1314800 RepID=A0A1B7MPA8_9AGAM|nr:hypothetical protein K503DRAFT_774535 [Rhizopogon vinicolor AM-OR11-026]
MYALLRPNCLKVLHNSQLDPSLNPSSSLDPNATNPFVRLGVGNIVEVGNENLQNNFFQCSPSSLTSASPDPSPKRHRLCNIFISSVLRLPLNESVLLKERLKRRLFTHLAL